MTEWPVALPGERWRPWAVPIREGEGLAWTTFSYDNGELRVVFTPFGNKALYSYRLVPETIYACRIVHPGKGLSFWYHGPCEEDRASFFVVENSAWIARLRELSHEFARWTPKHFVVVTPSGRLDLALDDEELRFEKVERAFVYV